MFEIKTEPGRRLLRIKICGMLTSDDVSELLRQERSAIHDMGCVGSGHVLLVDLTECLLQSQSVVRLVEASLTVPTRARRVAVVTGQSTSRMQVRRLLSDAGTIFATHSEAEAWLFPSQAGHDVQSSIFPIHRRGATGSALSTGAHSRPS